MPYKSERQRRFMKLCSNNPSKAKAQCPPKKVLREFADAQKRKKEVKYY